MNKETIQRGKYRLSYSERVKMFHVEQLEPITDRPNLHYSITYHDGQEQFRATASIPERQSREEIMAEISCKLDGEFKESHCHYLLNGDIQIDLRNPEGEITSLRGYFVNCPTIASFIYASSNREAALRFFNGL